MNFQALPATRELAIRRTQERLTSLRGGSADPKPYRYPGVAAIVEERVLGILLAGRAA